MTEAERIKQLEDTVKGHLDEFLGKAMPELIGTKVAEEGKKWAAQMALERATSGRDTTGLSHEQKQEFCAKFIEAASGKTAQTSEVGENGGLLIAPEVYAGIFRIAQQAGFVASMATRIPMEGTNEVTVPRFTGSDLEGSYLGVDTEGTETSVAFGDAVLTSKKWILLFRIDRSLIKKASVSIADFLMGLIAEGLAINLDRQGFRGTSPFVGIFNDSAVPVVTLASGSTTYAAFEGDKASEAIAAVDGNTLADCAFFIHQTVWHNVRIKKASSSGNYFASGYDAPILHDAGKGALQPQGTIWGYPVYCPKVLPKTSDSSQAGTPFGVFGSLKNLFYGDSGNLEISQNDAAVIGSRSAFASNQVGMRAIHEHALAVGLPAGMVVLKTAAS